MCRFQARAVLLFELDAPDKPAGTVVQVLEPGYMIHDRVLRPARVIVSSAPPNE